MDEDGNLLVKRVSKSEAYVKKWQCDCDTNTLSRSIEDHQNRHKLEYKKPFTLFNMKKFQTNIENELHSTYPNRSKLESECLYGVAFGQDLTDVLDSSVWVIIINVVALDMLKTNIPERRNFLSTFAPLNQQVSVMTFKRTTL